MTKQNNWDIFLSFFMFTANLQPNDHDYVQKVISHMQALTAYGYTGFDLPIAPIETLDHASEVESYQLLKDAINKAGLEQVKFTTNVAATRTFDPTSPFQQQREIALAYLKSRVDITKALGGEIMAGPLVIPYGGYPTTDFGDPIWSDALQAWLKPRYQHAQPVLAALAEYAEQQQIKLAIEPVDHWEQPGPNMVRDVRHFLEPIACKQLGVCVDSAHVVLGSDGPEEFLADIAHFFQAERLHYVQISAPDRGAIHDSWIPWEIFLPPLLAHYQGPLLIEVFNAIPVFINRLRQTRPKFWIPGEDHPVNGVPSAYDIARNGILALQAAIAKAQSHHSTK